MGRHVESAKVVYSIPVGPVWKGFRSAGLPKGESQGDLSHRAGRGAVALGFPRAAAGLTGGFGRETVLGHEVMRLGSWMVMVIRPLPPGVPPKERQP